jgi:hypothetical protein
MDDILSKYKAQRKESRWLGQLLVSNGIITPIQLKGAFNNQKARGCSLTESLVSLDIVTKQEIETFLEGVS